MEVILMIEDEINEKIKNDISYFKPHIRRWVMNHLIKPKKIDLFSDFNCVNQKEYWLITDHTGIDDASYRVIYCEIEKGFGLEMEDDNSRHIMMGIYGSFYETVDSI